MNLNLLPGIPRSPHRLLVSRTSPLHEEKGNRGPMEPLLVAKDDGREEEGQPRKRTGVWLVGAGGDCGVVYCGIDDDDGGGLAVAEEEEAACV